MPEKLIRIFEESYRNPRGVVKFQNIVTRAIDMPIGLKQGDVMSPIFFAVFIADLLWEVQQLQVGPKLGGIIEKVGYYEDENDEVTVPLIAFADDLMGMGKAKELQLILDTVGVWSNRKGPYIYYVITFSGF